MAAFQPSQHLRIEDTPFVITRLLEGDRVQLENLNDLTIKDTTSEQLLGAYSRGALQFHDASTVRLDDNDSTLVAICRSNWQRAVGSSIGPSVLSFARSGLRAPLTAMWIDEVLAVT